MLPSVETNWPTTEDDPSAFSCMVTSDTIAFSSNTIPQFVQTVSPRAGSTSNSFDLQCGQALAIIFLQQPTTNTVNIITLFYNRQNNTLRQIIMLKFFSRQPTRTCNEIIQNYSSTA